MPDLINSASISFFFHFLFYFPRRLFRSGYLAILDNKRFSCMNDKWLASPSSAAAHCLADRFPVVAQRSHSTKRGFPTCYVPRRR
ncbi:hypothetical protein KCP71_05640 [Salmonella enterica subsp. enterica]|nr:hypothetical protein KCP71_05640 [Salmonella enterica subsp. enterica]